MKNQKRILIVDDDEVTRGILCDLLEIEGYFPSEADDGKIGVRLHKKEPFDLIITDIIMPETEGLEVIRKCRQISPQVKIIAISGGGRIDAENYLNMAEKLGANLSFTKPFSKEDMINGIRKLIG
jgi:DNA-binding response OmpR family regulator